ncbi:MAG: hypothetical protein V9G09_11255 [Candidatus Nanopelagicales bacterium]
MKEGEGTLLDNSMILFGSSISDGNRHDPNNLPIVARGRAQAAPSRPADTSPVAKGTPLCNLYVSMLDHMGTPVEKFGDSTGALALG